jgi:hypothetical protein
MKMEHTQCSETSDIKHHTPGNNPEGYTRHTEQCERLKSRMFILVSKNQTGVFQTLILAAKQLQCRSQWPLGLRRSSAAPRWLRCWWNGFLSIVIVMYCQVEVHAVAVRLVLFLLGPPSYRVYKLPVVFRCIISLNAKTEIRQIRISLPSQRDNLCV